MHRAIRSLVLTMFVLVSSSGLVAAKSFTINPQAGLTTSHRTGDPGDLSTHGRVGWLVGGNVRLGEKVYLSPGAYLQRTNIQLSQKDTLTAATVEDVVGVNSLYLPLRVGVNLGQSAIGFRLFGGPSLTIVNRVDSNAFGITKDDYKSSSVGIEGGAGIDLTILTFDVTYEASLGKVFKNSDTKQQTLRAAVGIRI